MYLGSKSSPYEHWQHVTLSYSTREAIQLQQHREKR